MLDNHEKDVRHALSLKITASSVPRHGENILTLRGLNNQQTAVLPRVVVLSKSG